MKPLTISGRGWNVGAAALLALLALALSVASFTSANSTSANFGDKTTTVFPPWTPGTLDIHQLATGQGNAAFYVLPDGTTLLVDAGDIEGKIAEAPPTPDAARSGAERIARYVHQMAPESEAAALDFVVLTHFHSDHMGFASDDSPRSAAGGYGLAGITALAERVPIRHLLDRGWPDYAYPKPLTHPGMANYRQFLAWQIEHRGLVVARFAAGRADQIRLLRDPAAFPDFEIRGLAVNGEVWTGEGAMIERRFPQLAEVPEADWPSENMCSTALRIRYGRFDYYTGGDLPGWPDPGSPEWHDLETPIARALGPVDVHVVNHHGSIDPASPFFLATLRPRVHILPSWAPGHPAPVVLKRLLSERIYPGPRDIFATRLLEATRTVIGRRAERLASDHGHVVVRVEPGGGSYRVWILEAGDEPRVLSVHGPYLAE